MLEIKREDLSKSKVRLSVTVPSVLMRKYFKQVYDRLSPAVEVKGFRKGQAPKALTVAAIGEQRISQEIIDLALNESYITALKQEKIVPVASPSINIKMLKDLTNDDAELAYDAEIDLLPEIKVGNYKNLKVSKIGEVKVDQSEVDQVLGHLQRQHATFEDKNGSAEMGDRIEMDFEGTERGVVLENLTSKNYPVILGSKVLIPEFEKEVVGLKKGDEKEFDTNIGKDKNKKKVHFKVKVLQVQKVNLPPMDDELAKKFGQQTIDELRLAVENDIAKQKETEGKRAQEAEIAEGLLKITKIEVPESLVEQETHRMIDELKNRTEMMGLPFEQYLLQLKKTEADLHHDFHEQAEKTVKVGLILGEIGKLEKIDLKDETAGRKVMEKILSYAQK